MLSIILMVGSLYSTDLPPARYQGDVSIRVRFAAPAAVDRYCHGWGGPRDGWDLGCFIPALRVIVIPNPCGLPAGDASEEDKLLCHEIGHVNGWPKDHPR